MTTTSLPRVDVSSVPEVARVMGHVRGRRAGPTLVAIGGLHGNEVAGILALRRVLDVLDGLAEHIGGEFIALAGNRAALARGVRFVERDLNRIWTEERLARLAGGSPGVDDEGGAGHSGADESGTDDRGPDSGSPSTVEDREQRELLRALDRIGGAARGEVHVLDLHTTSSVSGPWATIEDNPANRAFALGFPVPVILGLEKKVDGTLLSHLAPRIHVGMGFESGKHDDPRALERMVAALWIGIRASGLLSDRKTGEFSAARELLREDTAALPKLLEMRHRHAVQPDDGFRMKPGYVNLQPIREGEVLGHDLEGEVRAPEDGRILMPLYQDQGEDGFFVVRELEAGPGGGEHGI